MDNRTKQCHFCQQTIPLMDKECKYCGNDVPIILSPSDVTKGDWIDLGLKVKWASCNLGANAPEEFGDYYAWGETETKSEYTESNSKIDGKTLRRLNLSGIVDAKDNLTADYDVAKKLGKGRMPTVDDIEELVDECETTWVWMKTSATSGVWGTIVTDPNGNRIFFPAADHRSGSRSYDVGSRGEYWGATLFVESGSNTDSAYGLYFSSSDYSDEVANSCCYGKPVRPVMDMDKIGEYNIYK